MAKSKDTRGADAKTLQSIGDAYSWASLQLGASATDDDACRRWLAVMDAIEIAKRKAKWAANGGRVA